MSSRSRGRQRSQPGPATRSWARSRIRPSPRRAASSRPAQCRVRRSGPRREPGPGPPAGAGRPTDSSKDATDEAKGEEYWHSRVSAAREELRRNQAFAEALQSRINALSAEFSAKDDPAARALVADDRQKAIAELDRLTKQIADNQKAIADIEEDARRAGVPAGWIR